MACWGIASQRTLAMTCLKEGLAGLFLAEGEDGADEEEHGQDGPEDELEELGGGGGQAGTEEQAGQVEGEVEAALFEQGAERLVRRAGLEAGKGEGGERQCQTGDPECAGGQGGPVDQGEAVHA